MFLQNYISFLFTGEPPMQTFLPYPDFIESASCLDNRRLNNQINESKAILKTLVGLSSGWANHPAVKMWRGFEAALYLYYSTCQKVWVLDRGKQREDYPAPLLVNAVLVLPSWLGDPRLHASHQSKLIQKFYSDCHKGIWDDSVEPYVAQFPHTPIDLQYWWPIPIIEGDYVRNDSLGQQIKRIFS